MKHEIRIGGGLCVYRDWIGESAILVKHAEFIASGDSARRFGNTFPDTVAMIADHGRPIGEGEAANIKSLHWEDGVLTVEFTGITAPNGLGQKENRQ